MVRGTCQTNQLRKQNDNYSHGNLYSAQLLTSLPSGTVVGTRLLFHVSDFQSLQKHVIHERFIQTVKKISAHLIIVP